MSTLDLYQVAGNPVPTLAWKMAESLPRPHLWRHMHHFYTLTLQQSLLFNCPKIFFEFARVNEIHALEIHAHISRHALFTHPTAAKLSSLDREKETILNCSQNFLQKYTHSRTHAATVSRTLRTLRTLHTLHACRKAVKNSTIR